mgnify:CR=1 FL=1
MADMTSRSTPSSFGFEVFTQRIHFRWRDQISAYLFLLPALLVYGLFAWYPIIKTAIFSFQKVSLNSESIWTGFSNYQRMMIDPTFGIAWRNSFSFAGLSILMGFLVPIVVAIMVNEMRRARVLGSSEPSSAP